MDHRKRLDHARHHLKALDRAIRVFTKGDPYEAGLQYDVKERCNVVRIRERKPIPAGWALKVGDILHNYRAALDSITYALAVAHSGVPSKDAVKKIQFPICELPAEFAGPNGQCKRRLSLLSPAAQTAIEALQPYHGRVKGFRPALLVLNDLANIDKHRHIVLIAAAATSSRIDLFGPGVDPGASVPGYTGPIVDGTIIGKFAFRGASNARTVHPKVNVQPHLGLDIAFAQAPAAQSGSVIGFLDNLHDVIRDIVFPPLEALL